MCTTKAVVCNITIDAMWTTKAVVLTTFTLGFRWQTDALTTRCMKLPNYCTTMCPTTHGWPSRLSTSGSTRGQWTGLARPTAQRHGKKWVRVVLCVCVSCDAIIISVWSLLSSVSLTDLPWFLLFSSRVAVLLICFKQCSLFLFVGWKSGRGGGGGGEY